MRRLAALPAAGLLAVAALTAPASANAAPTTSVVAAPKLLKFGQSIRIAGEKGRPLRISPVGVYYHRPSDPKFAQPREKWFVAIAVKVTALSKSERIPGVVEGSGWRVRIGGRAYTDTSGNATSSPWVGRTDGPWITIHPGSPEVLYYSFDLPKTGGTLEWSTPKGVTRWKIPTSKYGNAAVIKPVLDAIADYEGN
ncbi:hypothetical protein [Nonomuraea candida]|uniref:hypothetical protein n=1 Tax=Nonomuraea candida TaxID=359159 RepID=UPI0005B97B21|nr:hypothetical protein [Nonomuraea candida]